MLPKERSLTKSLISNISDTPIQFVKGVGPKLAVLFESKGLSTVKDLLWYFPRSYEDRSILGTIASANVGEKASLQVTVIQKRRVPTRRPGQSMYEIRVKDDTGTMTLSWFHFPKSMEAKFEMGTTLRVNGEIRLYRGEKQITHPEVSFGGISSEMSDSQVANEGRVVPVYSEIPGVQPRLLRKIFLEAVTRYEKEIPDDLPVNLLRKYDFPDLGKALRLLHFPEKILDKNHIDKLLKFKTPEQSRLIFEEFLKFQILILLKKNRFESLSAVVLGKNGGWDAAQAIEAGLPFQLTGDQQKILQEIKGDFASGKASHRLIQGDVGSGKTIVALLSAVAAISEGHQVAMMAPSEILADQHLENARKFFGDRIAVFRLTGSSSREERRLAEEQLARGRPLLLIGTHALIEDNVQFQNLALILIDEQHRFGVQQRKMLVEKGKKAEKMPHFLSFTATPIPRTLAMTVYGDLSVSVLREKPPGRLPIRTKLFVSDARGKAYQFVRDEISQGRQAFFVFPLIQDSEAQCFKNLKSVESEFQRLSRDVFPDLKLIMIHGQMSSVEKDEVLERFKNREFDILLSTLVIEVGIDIPNATMMVIENAERFGLSQLHQLRGRVGRGKFQSYCLLLTHAKITQETEYRLNVLVQSEDGFEISEKDLEIRGSGELLGTRQSGMVSFQVADLQRDRSWLIEARNQAEILLRDDPRLELPANRALRKYLDREGAQKSGNIRAS